MNQDLAIQRILRAHGIGEPVVPVVTNRVPAEWTGRARLLRDQTAAAHERWVDAAAVLTAPLRPRDGFVPQYTRQSLSLLAARWKKLPEWGRLRLATKIRGSHLQIVETRLMPFRVGMPGWADDELSIAVILNIVDLRIPDSYQHDGQVLAAVGLHGLARRYERGADRSDKAVLRDLFSIAQSWPTAVRAEGGEFEIAVSGGGRWRGSVKILNNKPTLAVRTYIS